MSGSGIDKDGVDKLIGELTGKADRKGPVEMPDLPSIGSAATVNNYNGPVFNAEVSGAQIAWNNNSVTQNQQHNTSTVAPGFEELARFVTDLLRQLPQTGLDDQDRQDAEVAANEVLTEITRPEPEQSKLRRAVAMLRGVLAPVATGAVSGVAAGTQEWAQAAITGLTGVA